MNKPSFITRLLQKGRQKILDNIENICKNFFLCFVYTVHYKNICKYFIINIDQMCMVLILSNKNNIYKIKKSK